MLLFLAIATLILAVVCFFVIAFANGMATAPGVHDMSQWPSMALFIVSIACFILHHFLRNVPMHW
jgi:hypothetical protein